MAGAGGVLAAAVALLECVRGGDPGACCGGAAQVAAGAPGLCAALGPDLGLEVQQLAASCDLPWPCGPAAPNPVTPAAPPTYRAPWVYGACGGGEPALFLSVGTVSPTAATLELEADRGRGFQPVAKVPLAASAFHGPLAGVPCAAARGTTFRVRVGGSAQTLASFVPTDVTGRAVVGPSGADSDACGTLASPCRTLNRGLRTPATGVYLAPGVHEMGTAAVVGGGDVFIGSLAGKDATLIDCRGGPGGIEARNNASLRVRGLSMARCTNGHGGCLSARSSHLLLRDVALSECHATSPTDPKGGAIYCEGGAFAASGLTVTRSSAKYGGGVHLFDCKASLKNVTVEGNRLSQPGKGGGLYLERVADGVLDGVAIADNEGFFAGGLYGEMSAFALRDSRVTRNRAHYGAGLLFSNRGDIGIHGTNITGNEAAMKGGGVLVENSRPKITGAVLAQNAAGGEGGGVYAASSEMDLRLTHVADNTAGAGAGLYLEASSEARVQRSHLVANSARAGGGGIYAKDQSVVALLDCHLRGNSASGAGGGALLHSSSLTGSAFTLRANEADTGGALHCHACRLEVTGAVLEANVAKWSGGGLFADSESLVALADVTVASNRAAVGGGIAASGPLGVESSRFVGNRAEEGGGLAVTRSLAGRARTVVSNCSFAQNSARHNGGALLASSSEVAIIASTFVENLASGAGAGVAAVGDGAVLEVLGTTFSGNRNATFGSGLSLADGTLNVSGAILEDNVAVQGGGGLALLSGSASVRDTAFTGNAAKEGGAVFLGPASPGLARNAFARNAAAAGPDIFLDHDPGVELGEVGTFAALVCRDCALGAYSEAPLATRASSLRFVAGQPGEVDSGRPIRPFTVGFLDLLGNIAPTADARVCQVATPVHYDRFSILSKGRTAPLIAGTALFDSVVVEGELGRTYTLVLSCSVDRPTDLAFNVTLAECAPGYEPDASRRLCTSCPHGSFNLDGGACKPCPEGAVCPGGAAVISSRDWWRSSEGSEELFRCPLANACLQGEGTGAAACGTGYTGPLCAVCSQGYHLIGQQCVGCKQRSDLILPVATAAILALVIVVVFKIPLETTSDDATVKLRIFTSYVQMVGTMKTFSIMWPYNFLASTLSWFNVLNLTADVSSLTCGTYTTASNFYTTYVISLVLPALALATICIIYWLGLARGLRVGAATAAAERQGPGEESPAERRVDARWSTQRRWKRQWHLLCLRNYLWLTTLMYPGVSAVILQMFSRDTVDTGAYLRADYSVQVQLQDGTRERQYQLYVGSAYVFALLYPIGVPVGLGFLLHRFRDSLEDPKVQGLLSVLYAGAKKEYYLWEILELFKKLAFSAIPVILPRRASVHIVAAQILLGAYLIALLGFSPLRSRTYMMLQSGATSLILVTLTLASTADVPGGKVLTAAGLLGGILPGGLLLFGALCLALWNSCAAGVTSLALAVGSKIERIGSLGVEYLKSLSPQTQGRAKRRVDVEACVATTMSTN